VVTVGGTRLAVEVGDLTTFAADAVVNAANSRLAGGGGLDGAIHAAGGPSIAEELRAYDGCPTGSAVITGAGRLPARWVVHAVGPIWRGGDQGEPELLASAYRTALRLAEEAGAATVGLPAISAGIYGYPLREAATVAVSTVREYLAGGSILAAVTFVLRSEETAAAFREALSAAGADAAGADAATADATKSSAASEPVER
jgi:O-acetyl-ADP-ribose deacetylase (regulator of RNase III)